MPDWGFFSWPQSRMVEYEQMAAEMMSVAEQVPFEQKRKRLFFRGADLTQMINTLRPGTPNPRPPLVNQTSFAPHLLDAKRITWEKRRISASNGEPVSMSEHCRYGYLSNVEGVAWSVPLKYLALCGSLLVTPEPVHREYWYDLLVDGETYVKTAAMSEDVIPIMNKLVANQSHSKWMAHNLQRAAWQYLNRDAMFCYYRMLLLQYAALLEKGGATQHKTLPRGNLNVRDFILQSWKGKEAMRDEIIGATEKETARQQAEKDAFEVEKAEGWTPPRYEPEFVARRRDVNTLECSR